LAVAALAPGRLDAESGRGQLFAAVTDLLHGLQRPVLLVLDDVHWADESSLLLVRHLIRTPSPSGLLLVLTYRSADAPSGSPLAALLADLRGEAGIEQVPLEGLVLDDITAVLASSAANGLDDRCKRVVELVADATGGNALFVIEVLRSLVDNGTLLLEDGRWTAPTYVDHVAVPDGVKALVSRRFATLPASAQDPLRAAAIIGRGFDVETVARLAAVSVDDVLDAVDAAIAIDLVRPVAGVLDRVEFTHALVRDAIHDDVSPGRRLRLHRTLAEILAREDAPPADVAYQWLEAGPAGDPLQAATWCYRAAHVALTRQAAYEEALAFSDRGLEVLPAGDTAVRGVLFLVQVETLLTNNVGLAAGARARVVLDAIKAMDPRSELGFLARAFSYVARVAPTQIFEGAVDWVGRTGAELLAALPEGSALRARVVAVLALRGANLGTAKLEEVDQVLAASRIAGDDEALGYALLAAIDARANLPQPEQRRAMARELVPIAEKLNLYVHMPRLIRTIVSDLELGDRDAADADFAELQASPHARDTWTRSAITTISASLAALDGRFDEVDRATGELLRHGIEAMSFVGPVVFFLAMHRGDTEGTRGFLEQGIAGGAENRLSLEAALSVTLARSPREDDRERARSLLHGVLERVATEDDVPVNLAFVSEAAIELEDPEAITGVRPLLEVWSGYALSAGYYACFGAADHWLGQCLALDGRLDEADGRLSAAHRFHRDRLRSPVLAASTAAAWSAVARLRGDSDRADELAAEARAAAVQFGLRPLLRRRDLDSGG
jgi:hypothetical protein